MFVLHAKILYIRSYTNLVSIQIHKHNNNPNRLKSSDVCILNNCSSCFLSPTMETLSFSATRLYSWYAGRVTFLYSQHQMMIIATQIRVVVGVGAIACRMPDDHSTEERVDTKREGMEEHLRTLEDWILEGDRLGGVNDQGVRRHTDPIWAFS